MKNEEKLLEILEKEFENYEQLEGILLEERRNLKNPKSGELGEQIGFKAQIVGRLKRLEEERTMLMSVISVERGLDPNGVRLLDLLRDTPAPFAGRLMNIRVRLLEKTEKVNRENEFNRQMIDSLLFVMNGVMDSVRSAFAEPAMYGGGGKMGSDRVNSGDIVSQAV